MVRSTRIDDRERTLTISDSLSMAPRWAHARHGRHGPPIGDWAQSHQNHPKSHFGTPSEPGDPRDAVIGSGTTAQVPLTLRMAMAVDKTRGGIEKFIFQLRFERRQRKSLAMQ